MDRQAMGARCQSTTKAKIIDLTLTPPMFATISRLRTTTRSAGQNTHPAPNSANSRHQSGGVLFLDNRAASVFHLLANQVIKGPHRRGGATAHGNNDLLEGQIDDIASGKHAGNRGLTFCANNNFTAAA